MGQTLVRTWQQHTTQPRGLTHVAIRKSGAVFRRSGLTVCLPGRWSALNAWRHRLCVWQRHAVEMAQRPLIRSGGAAFPVGRGSRRHVLEMATLALSATARSPARPSSR